MGNDGIRLGIGDWIDPTDYCTVFQFQSTGSVGKWRHADFLRETDWSGAAGPLPPSHDGQVYISHSSRSFALKATCFAYGA